MTRKWHNPPNWDRHLEEAIEEVNALAPAVEGLVAVEAEPRREVDPLAGFCLATAAIIAGTWIVSVTWYCLAL